MLSRLLDDSYEAEVRQSITALTVARTAVNACFRFAAPFLALVASDLDVGLDTLGVGVTVGELAGLLSPAVGLLAERIARRTSMLCGLTGVAVGATLAATAQNVAMFAAGLVVLSLTKVLFDLGLSSWVSQRVPYERRGRVIGLTETAWAFGLLIGVSAMGTVATMTSWRVGYAVGIVAVVGCAVVVRSHITQDTSSQPPAHTARAAIRRLPRVVVPLAVATTCLMAASQMIFVTFGSWLIDEVGFSSAGVTALVFGLGSAELFASLSSANLSDRWGKERAGAVGAAVMVPAGVVLAAGHDTWWVGIPALVVAIAAFEFAIVSAVPLGTHMVPGAPAIGMSVMLAAGTMGRGLSTVPATRMYVRHGIGWPALWSAGLAAVSGMLLLVVRSRRAERQSALSTP